MTATTASRSAKAESPAEASRRLPATVMVGRVLRPHGVRGEVKVDIQSDVEERFAVGSELLLVFERAGGQRAGGSDAKGGAKRSPRTVSSRTESSRRVRIASIRPARSVSLILFEGCSTREDAEEIRGARLEVEREKVPPAPDGCWYYYELIGCRCIDARIGELGEVVDLLEDGGGHILRIRRPRQEEEEKQEAEKREEVLVPMVAAFLREVDIEAGTIQLDLPEGLVETCTSRS